MMMMMSFQGQLSSPLSTQETIASSPSRVSIFKASDEILNCKVLRSICHERGQYYRSRDHETQSVRSPSVSLPDCRVFFTLILKRAESTKDQTRARQKQ